MLENTQLFPSTIPAMLAETVETGLLTQRDLCTVLEAILHQELTDDERRASHRILYAVRRGWVQLVA